MRRFLQFLCLFPALGIQLSAIPVADLIDDTQSLVIIAHDVPALIDRLQDSPWADTWNDDRVKKFLAPLREKIRCDDWENLLKASTGLTPATLQTLVSGDLLIALPSSDTSDRLAENPQPPGLLAAELAPGAAAQIQTLLSALADKSSSGAPPYESASGLAPETYSGVTLNTLNRTDSNGRTAPIHWAISQNTLIASHHRDLLLRALDAQQRGGAENPFGKTKSYLDSRNRTAAAPGIFLLLNFQTGPLAPGNAGRQPGFLPIPPELFAALGLDALNDLTIALTLAPASTRIETTLTYTDKRGLIALAAFDDTPLQLPAFASAGWPVFSVANYDIPAALAAIEDTVAASNPPLFAFCQTRLDDAAAHYNLNIKRDLIGSMGGQAISASVIPPGIAPDAPDIASLLGSLYVIELKDPRTFQNTLAGLIRAAGLEDSPALTKRDYLGATIYALNDPRQPLSIAVAKNQFILAIGAASITETAVQNIINGPANPVTADPAIRAAFDAAPSDIRYFTAQDMRFTLRLLATLLPQFPQTRALVEPAAIPPPAAFEKYWGTLHTWLVEKSDTLRATTEIPYKK